MTRTSMRPRKGDLLVTLRGVEGEVTVLVEKDKVKRYHTLAIRQMEKVLSSFFMGPTKKKPHAMATPLDPPCRNCDWTWQQPVVDTSDKSAAELPVYLVCSACKTRVAP